MDFSICGIWVSSVPQTRSKQDIEKRLSVPLMGVKIKRRKFSFLFSHKFAIFPKFSKNHILLFLLMCGLCHINGTQLRM